MRFRLEHSISTYALILSALSLVGCPSAPVNLGWTYPLDKVYTGGGLTQLADGGFFAVGLDSAPPEYLAAGFRISPTGSLVWGKVLDGLYVQRWWAFGIPVAGSEFVIAGLNASSNYSTARQRVVKLSGNGEMLWDRVYGDDRQQPSAMCATGDGGCVIASSRVLYDATPSISTYIYQVVLRKINSVGDVVWERYLESPRGFMAVYHMMLLADNGFVLAGSETQILRVDSVGNPLWWNQCGDGLVSIYGLGVASDGGFVLAGTSTKSLPTPQVFRTDSNGNLLWTAENIIPNQGNAQYSAYDAALDNEGRIVLVGHLQHVAYIGDFFPVITNQGFIAQLNSSAHLNWSKTLDVNEINGVTVTTTGDYATVGSDGNHLQVIRVDTSGKIM